MSATLTAERGVLSRGVSLEKFFGNLDSFTEVAGGVLKLRELILDLAVRGKLVEQDPNDEPASILFKHIQNLRQALINNGKLREPKQLFDMNGGIPHEIPSSWLWTRLGSLQIFTNGFAFKSNDYQEEGVGIIRIGDIQGGEIHMRGMKFVSPRFLDELGEPFQVKPGDLLIAMSGATTGKLGFNRTDKTFLLNQRVGKIELLQIDPRYACFYLTTKIKENLRISVGSAIPNLSTAQINDLPFPLPPLAEQKRIVAKVDQLMSLCDELESRGKSRVKIRERANRSCLASLTSSRTRSELNGAWRRLCDHFEVLYDAPETIADLRQSILQLAVQGKLVRQDPNDEPANQLLARIDIAHKKLIETKQIKRPKPITAIENSIHPFSIPGSWEWVQIAQVARLVEYGTSQKASENENGIPVLRMNNIQDGRVVLDRLKYVPKTLDELPGLFLQTDDLLFNRTNSYELVGKTGIFKGESNQYTFASYLIRIRNFDDVSPDYLNLAMNAGYYRTSQIEPELTQQCGQANFNGTKMKNSLVPLPPSTEQKRIVAKVNILMTLCDELFAKLQKRQATTQQLLTATIHQLLNGAED